MATTYDGFEQATALTGTEIVPMVQDGELKKSTAQDIADLAGGGTPSLTSTQIAFGDGSNLMTSSANLTWYDVSGQFYVNGGQFGYDAFNEFFQATFLSGTTFYIDGTLSNTSYLDNTAHDRFFGINTNTPTVALDVVGTVNISEVLKLAPLTFATLPATPLAGMIAYITDSGAAEWSSVVTGGDITKVIVFYNGTNWTVMGK